MRAPSFTHRSSRRIAALVLAGFLGLSAAASAWGGEGRGHGRGASARGGPFAAGRAMRAERGNPRAQQAREQAPPQQPARPPDPVERPSEPAQVERSGRPGRLTPDERRALRQQINDAGRDIYRPNRP